MTRYEKKRKRKQWKRLGDLNSCCFTYMNPGHLRGVNLISSWSLTESTMPGMRLNHIHFVHSNVFILQKNHLPNEMVEISLEVVVDRLEKQLSNERNPWFISYHLDHHYHMAHDCDYAINQYQQRTYYPKKRIRCEDRTVSCERMIYQSFVGFISIIWM